MPSDEKFGSSQLATQNLLCKKLSELSNDDVFVEPKIQKEPIEPKISKRRRLDTDILQENIRKSFALSRQSQLSSCNLFTIWDRQPNEDTPTIQRRAGQILKQENENFGTKHDDPENELKSAIKAVLSENPEIEDEKLVEKILEIWKNLEGKINEKRLERRNRIEAIKKIQHKFQNKIAKKKNN